MSEFKKEQRYIVIKKADLDYACNHDAFSEEELMYFDELLLKVQIARTQRTQIPNNELECVVIESDWRCYDTAWDLVEAEHIVNQKERPEA